LAQIMALEDKKITLKEVKEILGTTDRKFSSEIAGLIFQNDSRGAIDKINSILNDGYDLQVFNKSFINYLRQLMLLKVSPELKSTFIYEITGEEIAKMQAQIQEVELIKIIIAIHLFLDAQNKIAAAMLPQLPLEIAVIKATHKFPSAQPVIYSQQPNNDQEPRNKEQEIPNSQFPISNQIPNQNEQISENLSEPESNNPASNISIDIIQSHWNRLLEEVKPFNHSLKALLSNCKVISMENNKLTLATAYDFYKDKLNEPANRLTIEKVLASILGSKITIQAVVDKNIQPKVAVEKPAGQQDSLVDSALKILGGKVVEE